MRSVVILSTGILTASSVLTGCPKPPAELAEPINTAKQAELGLLMKEQINPAFSKLSFLVFRTDGATADRAALKAEQKTLVTGLRQAIGRLRVWEHPPTQSSEGKDVFLTYAESLDKTAAQLELAIDGDDEQTSARSLEQMANTCNSCHHFFRLDIKDSVVGPNMPPQQP